MVHLEEQIENGKRLISRGKSLGKDTKVLEERVRVLEARLKERLEESPERKNDSSIGEGTREVIQDGHDSKHCEIIHPEPNDSIQETPQRNVDRIEAKISPKPTVTVGYENGCLNVKSKINLMGILKKKFPKDTVGSKDGIIFVAFYYLPILLRALKREFTDEEVCVDRGIPYIEEVEKHLDLEDTVNVETELLEAVKEPVTRLFLDRKERAEARSIIQEIEIELWRDKRRDKWLDSVWKKAGMGFAKPSSGWRRVKTGNEWVWVKTSESS